MNMDIDEGNRKQFKDKMKEEIPPRRVVLVHPVGPEGLS